MILQQADSTKAWRDYVDPEDQTINKYKRLLNKCGIWGSLLGALNATKIARYEGGFHRLHIFTGFSVKARANASNIENFACWMKCWMYLRGVKFYEK